MFNHPGASPPTRATTLCCKCSVHNPGLPPFVVPDGAPLDSFAAPEPASVAILGLAVAALLPARRRRLRIG